jgi:hypothetical protein
MHIGSVMVDSESKGIGGMASQPWISADDIVIDPDQSGRGNNWAFGYASAESAEPGSVRFGSLISRSLERGEPRPGACRFSL